MKNIITLKVNYFDGFKKTIKINDIVYQIYKMSDEKFNFIFDSYCTVKGYFNQKYNIINIIKRRKINQFFILKSNYLYNSKLINNIQIFDEYLILLSEIKYSNSENVFSPFLINKENFFYDNITDTLNKFYNEELIYSHDKLYDNVILSEKGYTLIDMDSLCIIPKRFIFGFMVINRLLVNKKIDIVYFKLYIREVERKIGKINNKDVKDFLLFYLWYISDESHLYFEELLKIYKGIT